MRVTVLGKSPSWQDVDGACSGYLVEEDGAVLLLDCGNGVFSKLRRFRDYIDIDAVVVSHLHADHFLDLVPYSYALTYAPRQQAETNHDRPRADEPARPALHVPAGAQDMFRRIVGAWGNENLIENAFHLREYGTEDELEAGPMRVRFREVPHFTTRTHAVEIVSGSGARFTFGADSRPSEELVAFARETDLLVVEATLTRPEPEGPRGHMTPAEAGEHGRVAGAKRLVLTHISDELDQDRARREAARTFGGEVELAAEGAVYEI